MLRLTHPASFIKSFLKGVAIIVIALNVLNCAHQDPLPQEAALNISNNTSGNANEPEKSGINVPSTSSKSKDLNKLILEKAINASVDTDYILGPEDLIEIDIYQVEELNRTVRVSSSGIIKLPLAGQIKVSGLTVPELEEEIGKRLQLYLQEPVASVFIREYRSQRITVLGAVNRPQVYNVTGQKFLLDMLSVAEGLTADAGDISYIQRGDETIIVSIHDLLLRGDAKLNIPVFSGDVITVPKGGTVFVNGAVNEPGSFTITGTLTLTQSIAMARGVLYEAKRDQIRIYRNPGTDKAEIIHVDYDAILAEDTPDIVLKDKDVVIVPKSQVKNFFSGFFNTFRGLVSFGERVSIGTGL